MKLPKIIIMVVLLLFIIGCSNQKQCDLSVTQPQQFKDTTQEVSTNLIDPETLNYPSYYPKLIISCASMNVPWIRGDANFTGKVNGVIGNTAFGLEERKTKLMETTDLKPNSLIEFNAEEVKNLEKPKYKAFLLNSDYELNELPINKNSIAIPSEEGVYVYNLLVDWGKGDNTISYWFKVKVVNII
ncbi:hypothetical protein JCM14036_18380 [Desulfotomaculum defluvii]